MIVAPAAPIAPAWFTVAMPARIEPSTATMSASGGNSASSAPRMNAPAARPPSCFTAGAVPGRRMATARM